MVARGIAHARIRALSRRRGRSTAVNTLQVVFCEPFLANEITPDSAPSGRLRSSFFLVLGLYYFYLTPAPGNLCSTISRTLNSFSSCRTRPIYGVGVLSGVRCRLIPARHGDNRLCSPLIKDSFVSRPHARITGLNK